MLISQSASKPVIVAIKITETENCFDIAGKSYISNLCLVRFKKGICNKLQPLKTVYSAYDYDLHIKIIA